MFLVETPKNKKKWWLDTHETIKRDREWLFFGPAIFNKTTKNFQCIELSLLFCVFYWFRWLEFHCANFIGGRMGVGGWSVYVNRAIMHAQHQTDWLQVFQIWWIMLAGYWIEQTSSTEWSVCIHHVIMILYDDSGNGWYIGVRAVVRDCTNEIIFNYIYEMDDEVCRMGG